MVVAHHAHGLRPTGLGVATGQEGGLIGMKTVYLALAQGLLVAREGGGAGRAQTRLDGLRPTCLAADPYALGRLYCGTFGRGLWRSEDAGALGAPSAPPRAASPTPT